MTPSFAADHYNFVPEWQDKFDPLVVDFCRAPEASKEQIPWAEQAPLPLAPMVRDTPEGHLEVPLHPAAEKFRRERGYL